MLNLALLLNLFCLAVPAQRADAGERLSLNFNSDWKFTKSDPANASAPNFDDSAWTTVSTPHCFNDVDTFNNFALPGMRGEENQWSGRTWYRKTFQVPDAWREKKVYIEFQAVRQFGEVYLNGHRLGISKNGFIPFGFDLTPYLDIGKPNTLAVMCDNRFMMNPMPSNKAKAGTENLSALEAKFNSQIPDDENAIQADQIPWNNPQWHPAMGGIYRDVKLYVTDPLHITLPLYDFLQTEGPYVYATDISDKAATIHAEIPVENGRSSDAKTVVNVEIRDRNGNSIASLDEHSTIAAGASAKTTLSVTIPNPQLWQPDFPYLYHVVCTVSVGGKTVDTTDIPFGIRSVHWDVNTGFSVNGNHLRLHGWGQKPVDEWPGLGDAMPDWMHFYSLDLMKEAGANWVRWGHCAAGPSQIQSCDELGLMVEQPGVDGESDTVGAAWKIRADAFRDLIIYYRNDPAITIWEGGNQKVSLAHVKELRGYMDQYDPHGGRAYSHRRADNVDAQFMDVCIGTEGGHEIGSLPVVEGEYDREESPRRVWDDFSPPNYGYPEAKGQTYDLTSEQYAVNEVAQYVRKTGAPNHSGGANWIFSDSTSGGRNTAEVSRASGEVDGVRLPKEAYYVCQTMFRDDPQVHIIGHWNYAPGTKKTVYVTSNCGEVELLVNGTSLGHGRQSDRYLFTFDNVAWQPGEIEAIGYYQGQTVATNTIHTAGDPVALRITAVTGPHGFLADGSDITLLDVEAVDANGQRCPTFQKRVDFDCTGPAIWRGGYDSGKPGSISNKHLDLECGLNRVAVRSTLQPGDVSVTARCDGLKSATTTIQSLPVQVKNGCTTEPAPLPAVTVTHASFLHVNDEAPAGPANENIAPGGVGRYIVSFSYSGPTTIVHVEQNAADGKNIFVDRDMPFSNLPGELTGADWVQGADSDSVYTAVDLMQVAVKGGSVISIAHDDRIALPAWMAQKFKPTGLTLMVDGQKMKVYQHRTQSDESLTLGSNTDDPSVKKANAYIVFVNTARSMSQR